MKQILLFFIFFIAVPAMAQIKPLDARNRCEQSPAIVFSYRFTLCLPQPLANQTAIAKADDLLIKFYDGSYIFGKVITADMDALPATFDMRRYPEYAFGIRDLSELPSEQGLKFKNALEILRGRIPDSKFLKTESGGLTTYLMYGKESAEAFVVSTDSEQVLQVGFSNIGFDKVQLILKGFK